MSGAALAFAWASGGELSFPGTTGLFFRWPGEDNGSAPFETNKFRMGPFLGFACVLD